MKKLILSFACVALMAVAGFAQGGTVELSITGITCGGCASKAQTAINGVEGVTSSEVTAPDGNAVVEYTDELASVDDIIIALKDIGYKATIVGDEETTTTDVEDKAHCDKSCDKTCCKD